MKYTIAYRQPETHFLEIVLEIEPKEKPEIRLELARWRPGRYQLANFAKNIRRINAEDEAGKPLRINKVGISAWEVARENAKLVRIRYEYFAFQLDGGGSWLDSDQLYVNFLNCLLYDPLQMNSACSLKLEVPESYFIACALSRKGNELYANDLYELLDSPVIASPTLQQISFSLNEATFHLWFQGGSPDEDRLTEDFQGFAAAQYKLFGGFPFREYHFLFQLVPYKFYHGVEHKNSTVIVLGPDHQINQKALYDSLMGVSSHELFHAWNVCRIRPSEMQPYLLDRETLFETGYVAEGVTTYYGDLMLARSGYFSEEAYFSELNILMDRHFRNYGRFNSSLAESSYDLWLDGYDKGTPYRKVSIYIKGGLAALILDLLIRKKTKGKNSLDTAMRLLWKRFGSGECGYNPEDYQKAAEEAAGAPLKDYFEAVINGTEKLEKYLSDLLPFIGCLLEPAPHPEVLAARFGIVVNEKEGKWVISDIAPESPAEHFLSIMDEIIAINGIRVQENPSAMVSGGAKEVHIHVIRQGKVKEVKLGYDKPGFFRSYHILNDPGAEEEQIKQRQHWLRG